jgi:hypothetical protein
MSEHKRVAAPEGLSILFTTLCIQSSAQTFHEKGRDDRSLWQGSKILPTVPCLLRMRSATWNREKAERDSKPAVSLDQLASRYEGTGFRTLNSGWGTREGKTGLRLCRSIVLYAKVKQVPVTYAAWEVTCCTTIRPKNVVLDLIWCITLLLILYNTASFKIVSNDKTNKWITILQRAEQRKATKTCEKYLCTKN